MLLKLSPYLIAITIGFMIGIERERHHADLRPAMGVRSFLLLGLLGAVAKGVDTPIASLGIIFFASMIILSSYLAVVFNSERNGRIVGITTEIAAMSTFALGYLSFSEPVICLVLGVIVLLVLLHKEGLHNFTKKRIKTREINAAAVLMLLAVGVIPLLPNYTVDHWNVFNPQRLGIIISLIALVQFVGYALSRLFGNKVSTPVLGFLSGLVSGTGAFLIYARESRSVHSNISGLSSSAMFSLCATYTQAGIILMAISPTILLSVSTPLSLLFFVSGSLGVFFNIQSKDGYKSSEPDNPLSLMAAVKLGVALTGLIIVVELTNRLLPKALGEWLIFLSSLWKMQGVVLASANMFENDISSLHSSVGAFYISIIANIISKIGIVIYFGSNELKKMLFFALMLLLFLSVIFLFVHKYF